MATIKKSEVERLQKAERDLDNEAAMWCRFTVQYMNKKQDLQDKLWAAEQEIHDLKVALERQRTNANGIVTNQAKEIQKLVNLSVDLVARHFDPNWPIEQIDPPTCLNGFDALKWSAARAYEPNSGPY